MFRSSLAHSPVDPLGAGAVLLSVAALTAMFAALREPAPPISSAENASATVVVDRHHPVDRHDDVTIQTPDAWAIRNDVHHPVDRHEP